MIVAAYVEQLAGELAAPTVKQHLAALRMLFDYLVTGQVIRFNPAASVRGPRLVIRKGKTPVMFEEEARQLLASIDPSDVAGARDRAIFSVMTYTFARVGAVVGLRVRDYATMGRRSWFVLHEKGGRHHQVPAHRKAAEAVEAYRAERSAVHTAATAGTPRPRPCSSLRTSSGTLSCRDHLISLELVSV